MRRHGRFARGAAAVLVLAAAALAGHAGVAAVSVSAPSSEHATGAPGSQVVRHDVAVDLATAGAARPEHERSQPDRVPAALVAVAAVLGLALASCECVALARRRVGRPALVALPGRRAPPLLAV